MGKKSKAATNEEENHDESVVAEATNTELTYEEKAQLVIPIAQPLASRKLAKRVYKLYKKGISNKSVARGLKLVKKKLRKGTKGIVVLAGDCEPIDVISHFPVMCEEKGVPYVWVPTSEDLKGIAAIIEPHEDYQDTFDQAYSQIKDLPHPV